MESPPESLAARAKTFCDRKKFQIEKLIGSGQDGAVYRTNRITAIKVFKYQQQFLRELEIYQRLKEKGVLRVEGSQVPKLLDFHEELWVIEMQVVEPPFVLDFAAAYLDRRPPYTREEINEWDEKFAEDFGDDWETVQSIRAVFRSHGIHLTDITPRNIRFR